MISGIAFAWTLVRVVKLSFSARALYRGALIRSLMAVISLKLRRPRYNVGNLSEIVTHAHDR